MKLIKEGIFVNIGAPYRGQRAKIFEQDMGDLWTECEDGDIFETPAERRELLLSKLHTPSAKFHYGHLCEPLLPGPEKWEDIFKPGNGDSKAGSLIVSDFVTIDYPCGSFRVVPSAAVLKACEENMLVVSNDKVYFKVVVHETKKADVYVVSNQILASRYLARIDAETIPKKKEETVKRQKQTPPPALLDDPVRTAVSQCEIAETFVRLPKKQLARDLYEKVKAVMTVLGGKWNTSGQCFKFADDPREKLAAYIETGDLENEKKDRQAFYTPDQLAAHVVELAEIAIGNRVLEPSAGDGALLRALPEGCEATGVELSDREAAKIDNTKFSVFSGDFLDMTVADLGTFDRIVMNPPFSKNQDCRHVKHALRFLRPGGILVAIMWPNRDRRCFSELADGYSVEIEDVDSGAFKSSGTDVATMIVKFTDKNGN